MKLVFLFALVLVPGVFAAVPLAVNETYAFNWTAFNASSNSSFPASELFVCAENVSIPLPQNVTLALLPGEVRTATVGICSASASCAAGNVSNATCVINRSVAPGEVYRNVGGSCDVQITVGNATANASAAPTGPTVPYRYVVEVSNTNGILTLTVGNKSSAVDVSRNGVLYREEVEVELPANPSFQETDDVDYLVKQCRSWVPMLDETISTLVENTRTCSDSAKSHVDDLKLCGERERGLLAQIGTLTAERDAAVKDRETAVAARTAAEADALVARGDATAYEFLMWTFVASTVVFGGALLSVVITGRQRRRGAE